MYIYCTSDAWTRVLLSLFLSVYVSVSVFCVCLSIRCTTSRRGKMLATTTAQWRHNVRQKARQRPDCAALNSGRAIEEKQTCTRRDSKRSLFHSCSVSLLLLSSYGEEGAFRSNQLSFLRCMYAHGRHESVVRRTLLRFITAVHVSSKAKKKASDQVSWLSSSVQNATHIHIHDETRRRMWYTHTDTHTQRRHER